MIQVQNLRKEFGSVVAVDRVSFTINSGEIYGLLGPNGAGKTSTMRMIYGIVKPTAGQVSVGGVDVVEDPASVQSQLGVLPDNGSLYTRLTARENITYFAQLHQQDKTKTKQSIEHLVDILSMESIIDRRTEGFSQGERMKVALARAVVHQPQYVLLDEPTNGLDVVTTRAVRRFLLDLKQRGKSIIFSSHLMHEVSYLCDRVGIIASGRVAEGSVKEVIEASQTGNLEDAFVSFAYPNSSPETNMISTPANLDEKPDGAAL